MRIVLISLERAVERREKMAREFARVGLEYTIKDAKDGRHLTQEDLDQVDWEGRRQLGLRPQDNASIGCWLSHREVMHDLIENGPEMMAVFEDDARLTPAGPEVLEALEAQPFDFDIVSLYRGHAKRPIVAGIPLTRKHAIGRARFSDDGAVAYVISRAAAGHFLDTTPRMLLALDQAMQRYWLSGLNTYYIDPMVVHHGGDHDSYIEADRQLAREIRRARDNVALTVLRRLRAGIPRAIRKRVAFRKLLRGEIGVTRW